MVTTRRVSLAGEQLDKVHDAVVIQGIDTGIPNESISAVARMGGSGQRITAQHWNTMDVQVRFGINIRKTDLEARREAWESVIKWANRKGWLQVSYLPGRQLYVDKAVLPSSGDLWNWTDTFTITFRAYNIPFWQAKEPDTLTVKNITNGTRSMEIGGNAETVADMKLKNISGKQIDTLTIGIGGISFAFAALGLGGTETLTIAHRTDGTLSIRATGAGVNRSLMNKRTAESSDDLYVQPGTQTITVESQRALEMNVSVTGRYF